MKRLAPLLLPFAVAASQPATPRFELLHPTLFAAGATLANAFADVDGDGDLDLFVGFNGAPNRLYRNTSGAFADVAGAAGIADARATRAAAWGDFDGDGDPDLLVGFAPGTGAGAGPVLRLYRNDSSRESVRFSDVTATRGITVDSGAVRQPVFVDVDGDGDRDLFVAFRDRANMLFRNDGATFTEIAASVGLADTRRAVGAVWFDWQQDGDLDLYVANQDGGANALFRNDGGVFTDVAGQFGIAWGGRAPNVATQGTVRPCVADFDNDGVADLFLANYGANGLFLGAANGTFRDVSSAFGVAVDSRFDTCAPADIDHDGRLDLYVNGTVSATESYRDYLYRRVEGGFTDVTPENLRALHASHGVAWGDVDDDGALDLALAGSRADASHPLMRNALPAAVARRSLKVRVVDPIDRSTIAGAEVRVFAAGTRRLIAMRWTDAGSGYDAQSDMPVHVGLPTMARVDVEVIVPNGRTRVRLTSRNVAPATYAGRVLTVSVPRR